MRTCSARQRPNAVTAYLQSEQILHLYLQGVIMYDITNKGNTTTTVQLAVEQHIIIKTIIAKVI